MSKQKKLQQYIYKIDSNLLEKKKWDLTLSVEDARKIDGIIVALAEGLIKSIPQLIKAIPQIVTAIVKGFGTYISKIKDIGKNIVNGVWEGINAMYSWFYSKVKNFFSGIVNSVKRKFALELVAEVIYI